VRRRLSLIVIVCGCVLGASAYATAQESPQDTIREAREEREKSRQEQAELAGELDVLEAEDDELIAALAAINDQVELQETRVTEAQAELDRIRDEIGTLNDQIILTRQRSEAMRRQALERVVRSYTQPSEPLSSSLLTSNDLHDGTRRQTLFRFATLGDIDLRDELRGVDDDLVTLEASAEDKQLQATEQQQLVAGVLAELETSQGVQENLRAALQDQIALIEDELDEMERQEVELARVIRHAQAEIAAERARKAAEEARNAAPKLEQRSPAGFIMPSGGWITSGFGTRRHPILGTVRNHAGVDFSGATGNPVWTVQSGVVITAGTLGGYGKTVIVDHGGYTTLYAHMSKIRVSVGDSIAQGTRVGDIGSTGLSTGPHLHFEVRVGGVAQNPTKYLP
jgi:murein DD-endopeptidase MepM/ murein hydrolase activator NlpD